MEQKGSRVVPGVQVLRVEQDGPAVMADIFGGENPLVMGEVEFRIDDPTEHQRVYRCEARRRRRISPPSRVRLGRSLDRPPSDGVRASTSVLPLTWHADCVYPRPGSFLACSLE